MLVDNLTFLVVIGLGLLLVSSAFPPDIIERGLKLIALVTMTVRIARRAELSLPSRELPSGTRRARPSKRLSRKTRRRAR